MKAPATMHQNTSDSQTLDFESIFLNSECAPQFFFSNSKAEKVAVKSLKNFLIKWDKTDSKKKFTFRSNKDIRFYYYSFGGYVPQSKVYFILCFVAAVDSVGILKKMNLINIVVESLSIEKFLNDLIELFPSERLSYQLVGNCSVESFIKYCGGEFGKFEHLFVEDAICDL